MLQRSSTLSRYRSVELFGRYGPPLTVLSVALIPIKLSWAIGPMLLVILLWLLGTGLSEVPRAIRQVAPFRTLLLPLLAFFLIALGSSLFGIRPLASIPELLGCLVFALIVPAWYYAWLDKDPRTLLIALIAGQSVAALHSLVDARWPDLLPLRLIGTVSESGQLALTVPALLGLTYAIRSDSRRTSVTRLLTTFLGLTACYVVAAFVGSSATSRVLGGLTILAVTAGSAWGARGAWKTDRKDLALVLLFAPLLVGALIVNLKRGPWAGALLGTTVFLLIYQRRLVLPALLAVATALTFVAPLRERLLASRSDFFIAGGRSEIWSIGSELAVRFPLGIGFDNSAFLRSFSTEVPPELRHFHNNLLNILVETGWFGLGAYLLWIGSVLFVCFRPAALSRSQAMVTGVGCAIIAWQAAGVVEYNFGDSEVLYVSYVLLALTTLALTSKSVESPARTIHPPSGGPTPV